MGHAINQHILPDRLQWEVVAHQGRGWRASVAWVEPLGIFFANQLVMCKPKTFWEIPFSAHGIDKNNQESYGACARLSLSEQWSLFYMRPKLHMFAHIVKHACKKLCVVQVMFPSMSKTRGICTNHLRKDVEYQLHGDATAILNPASRDPKD